MVEQVESLWNLLCFFLSLLQVLKKCFFMAIWSTASPASTPVLSWTRLADIPFTANKISKECSDRKVHSIEHVVNDLARKHHKNVEGNVSVIKNTVEPLAGFPTEKSKLNFKKRPSMLVIPDDSSEFKGFVDHEKEKNITKDNEVEGKDYCLASRKGNRHVMEDGYEIISNINGDSQQAYFGVFDGHGGRAAVDFVSENLGKNILAAMNEMDSTRSPPELAIKAGYLTTDREFLGQGLGSGACVATVLLKDGVLHVANAGDCRVVLSRKGVANALTVDHRAEREEERSRIESSGGFVTYRNGLWRVLDSLLVSRSIGDMNLKQWIVPEPETSMLRVTPDCEFLILASDGLWDKVNNQEAVDIVLKYNDSMKACKELIEISCSRGSRDDITVMVVNLQNFVKIGA